jgi:hypothetical protein
VNGARAAHRSATVLSRVVTTDKITEQHYPRACCVQQTFESRDPLNQACRLEAFPAFVHFNFLPPLNVF